MQVIKNQFWVFHWDGYFNLNCCHFTKTARKVHKTPMFSYVAETTPLVMIIPLE